MRELNTILKNRLKKIKKLIKKQLMGCSLDLRGMEVIWVMGMNHERACNFLRRPRSVCVLSDNGVQRC